MNLIKKYIDKFFEGDSSLAITFTFIYCLLGIGIITCLALIIVFIWSFYG